MCGIAGYIGESTNPELSFQLINKLFEKLEIRGKDASGFWGAQKGDGKILYHKEPTRSSQFVKSKVWQNVKNLDPNVLIVHSREASHGSGLPSINKNNHPFVNADLSVALVHNGRIPENIYEELRKKYEVLSACDSEILLRIFEGADQTADVEIELSEADKDISGRLVGLKDIWSTVSKGHMAVAIGELLEDKRRLWLFRNKYRSLWIFDLREMLGQVFFVSTPQIWQMAIDECRGLKNTLRKKNVKFIELPTEEIWLLEIDGKHPTVTDNQLHKFEVEATGDYEAWEFSGEQIKATPPKFNECVHTCLNESDELKEPNPQQQAAPTDDEDDYEYVYQSNVALQNPQRIYDLCSDIQQLSTDVEALLNQNTHHQNISHQFLISDLEFAVTKLRSVVRLLGG